MSDDQFRENLGLSQEEWDALSITDRNRLTGENWQTKPCQVCGKLVAVMGDVDPVLCLEHQGENDGTVD